MKNKSSLLAIALAATVVSASPAQAQDAPSLTTPSAAKQKLMDEYFNSSSIKDQLKFSFRNIRRILEGNMRKNLETKYAEDKSLTKEQCAEKADATLKKIMDNLEKRFDYEAEMLKITASIWDKHFSEAELKEIVEFNKSKAAKKYNENVPQQMAEAMQVLKKRLDPEVKKNLERRLAEMDKKQGEASN